MAGKVLPGSKYDTSSGQREFSVFEKGTGLEEAVGPYDQAAEGSVYVRDAAVSPDGTAATQEEPDNGIGGPGQGTTDTGKDAAGKLRERKDGQPEKRAGPGKGPVQAAAAKDLTWDEELENCNGDFQRAYRQHMSHLAREFKDDLMVRIDRQMKEFSEQAKTAQAIERERKNTIDYALSAYGEDADLTYIADKAAKSQQVNAKAMVGPLAGLSFKVNQKLSGGKDSLVKMPNGMMVEMDSGVAAVLDMPEKDKGKTMAGLFTGYVKEHDPTFMAAIEAAGGAGSLEKNGELQFSPVEEQQIRKSWRGVTRAQEEQARFEAKPTDLLTPKQYQELGLDPNEARERRLSEYGDPSARLQIMYSHEREYNGRRLPEPLIVGQYGCPTSNKELDDFP